jgi:hypothetical protein
VALGATVVDETDETDETALALDETALALDETDETALALDETALALRTEAPSMALCVMERKRRRGTLRLLSTTPIAVHGQAGESSRANAPDEGGHRSSSSEVIIRGHHQSRESSRAKAPDEGGHRHAIGEAFSEGKSSRSRLMIAI